MPRYIDVDAFIGWARTRYCKDCDRRKGMKNGKMRFLYDIGSAPCRACDVDDMVEDVDNFPAAEVEEVMHRKWREWLNLYFCERCECASLTITNYCPNCGARMDGKENGE